MTASRHQTGNPPMIDILVVDDIDDNRDLLAAYCKLMNLECHGCASGGEALEWLAENRPRVVLLDLAMPVLTGLDVADAIRKNEAARSIEPTIILFYTGTGQVTTSVRDNMERNNVKAIYIKASDSTDGMMKDVVRWIRGE